MESVIAVQQAKPRKAAGRKKVAALLAPDAPAISVAKAAVKPESKAVAKVGEACAKSAPKPKGCCQACGRYQGCAGKQNQQAQD
jgi:ribonuclease R